jgi:predicted nucleic acid-binding protein
MVELSEELAREAGALRYRARRPLRDTIDAIIVATADASAGSAILTADAGDMAALAAVRRRSPVLLLGHH